MQTKLNDEPWEDQTEAQAGDVPASRAVLWSIIGFWAFYTVIVSFRSWLMDFPAQGEMAVRRAIVTAVGLVITLILWQAIRRLAHLSLRAQIVCIAVLALPCALLIGATNYYFFNVYDLSSLVDVEKMKLPEELRPTPLQEIVEGAISRYFFLIAWAAFYMALSFAGRVTVIERRAASYARAAQTAELRALRYQVNPHFLFNTLNSLSALVMNNRRDEAESMIQNLANFYRTGLSGEPAEDVSLSEEIELQQLYLRIEKVRFPERLSVEIDVPERLAAAAVPGLILQPLVENAVKHGVSPVSAPVTVRIAAESAGGMLHLSVTDTGNGKGARGGGGIGLANVRDRLAARFGGAASLEAGALPEGGYRVTLSLPLVIHG